jgi:phage gpG-like protein
MAVGRSRVVVHDEALQRMLSRLNGNWPDLQRQLLTRYAEAVLKNAQENTTAGNPLHVRSGRLRRSLGWEFRGNDTAAVGTNVEYGPIHEFGGTITPRSASALRFQVNGQWVTTQKVRMPRRPWLGPALLDFARSAQQQSVSRSVLRRFLRAQS